MTADAPTSRKLQELRDNLFSRSTLSVLGPAQYARYLATFAANLAKIRSAGNLSPLDQAMGKGATRFRYRGSPFSFDCRFSDEHLADDGFGFGLVREIYIRDCYFKWHPPWVYERAKRVFDLGANRGSFSSLMTTQAEFILAVECQEQYVPVIRHNMEMNGFARFAVETAMVGAGGIVEGWHAPRRTIEELMLRHRLDFVDFVKMDIEGSEFALFEAADWLERVGAISMEVHPEYGDPNAILKSLERKGFAYALADDNVRRLDDVRNANFIYAWKDRTGK